jgi:hypothetical protein
MISKAETVTMLLRIPEDMKSWLEKEAARTCASRNNEILRCIRARMDTEQKRERAAG